MCTHLPAYLDDLAVIFKLVELLQVFPGLFHEFVPGLVGDGGHKLVVVSFGEVALDQLVDLRVAERLLVCCQSRSHGRCLHFD